jgi:hypothetical protein
MAIFIKKMAIEKPCLRVQINTRERLIKLPLNRERNSARAYLSRIKTKRPSRPSLDIFEEEFMNGVLRHGKMLPKME